MQGSKAPQVALFVFIPFCKIKCTYCDFNAHANLARIMDAYADAVAREVAQVSARLDTRLPARSVYFGGGTPSIVPVGHIEKILSVCGRLFALDPDCEITLEANPGTVTLDKLRSLYSLGVNRLSLGVQSFDEAAVRRLNRGHTVADAVETYDLARRAGFDNINLDFIYGLPLQTLDDWRETLVKALALQPEHLSLYALQVEKGTGLDHEIARGKYPMPDDDLAAEMYVLAEELLDAAGYVHYEISNWARAKKQSGDKDLRSRHNLTYWENEPYLGFGAGAHSHFAGSRYCNVSPPLDYVRRVSAGEDLVAGSEEIGRELEMAETAILGLRLAEGLAFKRFADRFGEDARVRYDPVLRELDELELIELSDQGIRLTGRGRLLSNQVFWRFLP